MNIFILILICFALGALCGMELTVEVFKYMCREGKMVFKTSKGKWIGIEYLVQKLEKKETIGEVIQRGMKG
jgi:hypothetical protein